MCLIYLITTQVQVVYTMWGYFATCKRHDMGYDCVLIFNFMPITVCNIYV